MDADPAASRTGKPQFPQRHLHVNLSKAIPSPMEDIIFTPFMRRTIFQEKDSERNIVGTYDGKDGSVFFADKAGNRVIIDRHLTDEPRYYNTVTQQWILLRRLPLALPTRIDPPYSGPLFLLPRGECPPLFMEILSDQFIAAFVDAEDGPVFFLDKTGNRVIIGRDRSGKPVYHNTETQRQVRLVQLSVPPVHAIRFSFFDRDWQNDIKRWGHPTEMESLYTRTLQEGKERNMNIRVNVIGPFGAGKTTVSRRLQGMSLDDIQSTEGIDVNVVHCNVTENGWSLCDAFKHNELRLANIGKKMSTSTQTITESNVQTVDTSNEDQTDNDDTESVEEFQELDSEDEHILPDKDQVAEFQNNIERETTSNVSRYISIWDFAGQFIYRATHQLFHSTNAVYLLVIDLTLDMKTEVSDEDFPGNMEGTNLAAQYKFWLNSIQTFVGCEKGETPPVILVGTHYDQLQGTEKERRKQADERFEEIRSLCDDKPLLLSHIQPEDFVCELSSSVSDLQRYIIDVADKFYNEDIPAMWIPLQIKVEKLRCTEDIVNYSVLKSVNDKLDCPLSDNHLKTFLTVQHIQGNLVYFDEDGLRDTIILDSQFIIDAFKLIVSHRRKGKRFLDCRTLWNRFEKDAVLSHELLQKILDSDTRDFEQHWQVLEKLLQRLCIFVQLQPDGDTETPGYLVPVMLKDNSEKLDEFLGQKARSNTLLVFKFDNAFVSPVIFYRLMCATIKRWEVLIVSKYFGVYKIAQSEAMTVLLRDDSIDVGLVYLVEGKCPTPGIGRDIRSFVELFLQEETQRFRQTRPRQYEIMLKCNHREHGSNGSNQTHEYEVEGVLPCPDFKDHRMDLSTVATEWEDVGESLESVASQDMLDMIPGDEILSNLAEAIGDGWKMLAHRLIKDDVKLSEICEDNPNDVYMQKFRVLQKWKQMNGRDATVSRLLQTLRETTYVHVDWVKITEVLRK